jgi:myo-inositol-1(or 4)-monophosphatase
MTENNLEKYKFILELTREAGRMIKSSQIMMQDVKGEDVRNVITDVDIKVNEYIKSKILEKYPEAKIYTEEDEGEADLGKGEFWTVDPIDGTSNFSRRIPHYASCISLIEGDAVKMGAAYNPCTDELFSFELDSGSYLNGVKLENSKQMPLNKSVIIINDGRDKENRDWFNKKVYPAICDEVKSMKAFGSSALDMCYVGAGRVDGLIYAQLNSFDIAFSIGFLRALGGVVRDESGVDVPMTKQSMKIIACNNERLHDDLIELIK